MKQLEIFIVDDHYLLVEGYRSILSFHEKYKIKISVASNCEEAYNLITKCSKVPDILILDVQLPPSISHNLLSGTDLIPIIRTFLPECKLIIVTSHGEAFLLSSIINKFEPDGLLVKSDFTATEFLEAFDIIVDDSKFYSSTVKKHLKELSGNL